MRIGAIGTDWMAEAARLQTTQDPAAVTQTIAGTELTLLPEGALWWPDEATLVVADLHLEKGSSFARRGMLLPPYDTVATLAALAALVTRLNPVRVISLGDAFHDVDGAERMAEASHEALRALQRGRDWIWIAGNHDPLIAIEIGGVQTPEIGLGPLVFRHEPRLGASAGEIAGHLHPAARVRLKAKSVRRRCFVGDGSRMILPAFGAYTGGLDVTGPAYRGLFDRKLLSVGLLGEGRVYAFPAHMVLAG